MLSYFVTAIDCSIIFTGEVKIAADLALDQTSLSWVQNIYVLAYGGLMLFSGRLGDAYGRKSVLNAALVLFCIGSLLAGAAWSVPLMIGARFLQGVGAALLAPTALALLMDYFDGQERVTAIAWYSSVSGLGMCVGLVLGGAFADFLSWRYGFFINVPLTLLMLFISCRTLRKGNCAQARFDIAGTIYSIVAVFSLVYAINGAQEPLLWLAVAAGGLAAFVRTEKRAPFPMLPLRLFTAGFRSRAYIARLLFAGSMMGYYFFVSQYMQEIFRFTPLQVGFAFFPLTLFTFAGAMLVPRLTLAWGDGKTLFAGFSLLSLGFAIAAFWHASPSYWSAVAVPMALLGLGQGLATSPMTNLGIKNVMLEDAGAASGMVNVAHQIGCSIGLSVMVAYNANVADIALIYRNSMLIALLLIAAAFTVTLFKRS
ncbi:MFS transporter [Phascolarctobacterium sp.]|uniref:MFS transporter n=1 Tax=Phascolarctobacterium sp. TaxID=2049039 RepID=UPI0026DB7F8B|nr:MFS transporter [Phascolarctobacterium sp.]